MLKDFGDWDHESTVIGHKVTWDLYRKAIHELTEELNEYHRIKWTVKQFDRLLGNWVWQLIQIVFVEYSYEIDLPNEDKLKRRITCVPVDPWSFNDLFQDDNSVRNQFSSELRSLREGDLLHLDSVCRPEYLECPTSFDGHQTLSKSKINIYQPYFSDKSRFRKNSNRLRMVWSTRRFAKYIHVFRVQKTKRYIDWDWRLAETIDNDLYSVCWILLRRYLPMCFLESFKDLLRCSNKEPMSFYTTNAVYYSLPFKFSVAARRDSVVLAHQHGGGYGLDYLHAPETHEKTISDVFYTWGWSEDSKTVPLPTAPRAKDRVTQTKGREILVMLCNFPRYPYRIHFHHMASQTQRLINASIEFCKTIDNSSAEIAFYAADYGWNVRQQFRANGVEFGERSKPIHHYALVVSCYVGTSCLETLAANIPTVAIYDPKVNRFRADAESYTSMLEKVGILFQCPQSAGLHVKSVEEDISKWWNNPDTQRARELFVSQYARLEEGFYQDWGREFERIQVEKIGC